MPFLSELFPVNGHGNGGVGGCGNFIQESYVNACGGVCSFTVSGSGASDTNGDVVDSFAVLGMPGHWAIRRHPGSLREDRTSDGRTITA